MTNNGWEEKCETVKDRPNHEEHDKDHDDMWGAGGTYNFFESEFFIHFGGLSIPF